MKYSFKGYSFKEWIYGNSKTIKEIAKVGIPLIIAWAVTENYISTGFATLIGKFVLDGIEYWFKE
jgi:hypothetical protein